MSFEVDTAALRAHASDLQALKGKADQATSAAHQVSFHPETYGLIGAALVYPLIAPLEVAGVASTELVGEALESTAAAVRGLADTYDVVDGAVSDAMEHLRGLLR